MHTIVDETSRSDPPKQIDPTVSRRSFLQSAAAAAVFGAASPHTLMAETKEGLPQRALGRTGEKVSAIGLGGYHIGKQADEAESKEAVTRLLARTAAAAATGRFELFKTGNRYDGTAHNPQWLG